MPPMASSPSPSYSYREEVPGVVSVPASELVARLPEELRGDYGKGDAGERTIELPCSEILLGNVPRITLGRLVSLAPELVRMPQGRNPDDRINLPPGWIALHFRMVTVRDEIAPASSSSLGTAKTEGDVEVGEKKHPVPSEPKESSPLMVVETPAESIGKVVPPSAPYTVESGDLVTPQAPSVSTENLVKVESSLVPPPPPRLERLWKLDPNEELSDPHALQALFMTEEKLTLEKVISKAGELPGLDACVLAHGDRVLCASKTPAGTDLQTLSGEAMSLLTRIRESSENMGLGAVPAVTLHADRGVVSFLHRGELCLLVLHADRGFVPGVRERLQEMLGHLATAYPALPPTPKS